MQTTTELIDGFATAVHDFNSILNRFEDDARGFAAGRVTLADVRAALSSVKFAEARVRLAEKRLTDAPVLWSESEKLAVEDDRRFLRYLRTIVQAHSRVFA